ncbi:hypothetical protein BDN67DRAFT_982832 [Paxillus ammoniavirescens]|nr:hypothetical protein BDN67DRAFT_982832 [Paxillus ammoniavirescens]
MDEGGEEAGDEVEEWEDIEEGEDGDGEQDGDNDSDDKDKDLEDKDDIDRVMADDGEELDDNILAAEGYSALLLNCSWQLFYANSQSLSPLTPSRLVLWTFNLCCQEGFPDVNCVVAFQIWNTRLGCNPTDGCDIQIIVMEFFIPFLTVHSQPGLWRGSAISTTSLASGALWVSGFDDGNVRSQYKPIQMSLELKRRRNHPGALSERAVHPNSEKPRKHGPKMRLLMERTSKGQSDSDPPSRNILNQRTSSGYIGLAVHGTQAGSASKGAFHNPEEYEYHPCGDEEGECK